MNPARISRRRFAKLLATSAAVGMGGAAWSPAHGAPAVVRSAALRPKLPSGIACGDVTSNGAVIWSRCDRPAKMIVEIAANETFRNSLRHVGPVARPDNDFVAKLRLPSLPPGERLFYRVQFENLSDSGNLSEPTSGSFRALPKGKRDILFAWSGDTVGQGWGIDRSRGGMRIYETIRRLRPDFFVHSGDSIYADNPLVPEVKLADGTVWKNLITPGKIKVAETAAEFRGAHLYNLEDDNFRRLCAEVPLLAQWDDHEVVNNWYPGEILDDPRYTVKDVDTLAARARSAFFDCMPIAGQATDKIYRALPQGPLVELFFLDMRTYRAANSPNRQPVAGPETAFLGREQLEDLKRRLAASKATWKVMCSDMPLGLLVRDGAKDFEAVANGDGPALGRELEISELLSFMKRQGVRNVIWLTADVHYAASHYYNPDKAQFQDFDPFWEFVSGPLHAGTFGPGQLDNTFGPEVRFHSLPKGYASGSGPAAGLQFFGTVGINGQTAELTLNHYNAAGDKLWTITLPPVLA